ncbi:MAG: hypothetical protein QXU18_13445 [Thermoplasmatales archaeon]
MFLVLRTSYFNEITDLWERISRADVDIIAACMDLDKRIAPYFLMAGVRFGGPVFPRTKTLLGFAKDHKVLLRFVETTLKVNDHRITHLMAMIQRIAHDSSLTRIWVLGAAFKSKTHDIRRADQSESSRNS